MRWLMRQIIEYEMVDETNLLNMRWVDETDIIDHLHLIFSYSFMIGLIFWFISILKVKIFWYQPSHIIICLTIYHLFIYHLPSHFCRFLPSHLSYHLLSWVRRMKNEKWKDEKLSLTYHLLPSHLSQNLPSLTISYNLPSHFSQSTISQSTISYLFFFIIRWCDVWWRTFDRLKEMVDCEMR